MIEQDNKSVELKEFKYLSQFYYKITGKVELNPLEKVMIFLNGVISFAFFIWHVISYIVISKRMVIIQKKNVNIEKILYDRGLELGYIPEQFIKNVTIYHFISLTLWMFVIINLIFMIRKTNTFFVILLSFVMIYYLNMFYNLGFTYYKEDTTLFDKIAIPILIINSMFYYLKIKFKKEFFD